MMWGGMHGGTVAILAQGTNWAVAATQAFDFIRSYPHYKACSIESVSVKHVSETAMAVRENDKTPGRSVGTDWVFPFLTDFTWQDARALRTG